jgi:phenylpropionate dioxygenase-like ring-hydroxylating dioxygenase large terminal subunit
MFSMENNETLTRVGPDTAMGKVFRRYWIPALLSSEIPVADCPPVRVRLLGENLVAFRDSRGRVGLLDEYCSHRRTSLYYGRNEECGLRCIYHGWKYDTEGRVLETPAEPPASRMKDKINHTAYPCREASGVVFTYMGTKDKMPQFPEHEWLTVPAGQVTVNKFYLECNYLQSLEGDCDPAHLPFLHLGKYLRAENEESINRGPLSAPELDHQRIIPMGYETEETPFGLRVVVTRKIDDQMKNVRVSTFVMPFIGCVPVGKMVNGKLDGFLVVYQTPSDDYHTTRYNFRFKRSEALSNEELGHDTRQIAPNFRLVANKNNDYLIDRAKQKSESYSGIPGFRAQDACVTESMGAITNRAKEHLGFSDQYVIALRRYLLKTAQCVEEGHEAPGINLANSGGELNCIDVTVPIELLSS